MAGSIKVEILQYTVSLTDQDQVARIQAALDAMGSPSGIIMAPTLAVTTYKAPIEEEKDAFKAPCIRSPWFTPSNNYPRDKATFERDSGGFWGWFNGETIQYAWCATFTYAPSPGTEPVVGNEAVTPISARRWLDGFEHGGLAEGTAGQQYVARGASRHLQGYGWRNDRHTEIFMHQDDESGRFGVTPSPLGQWERFYIRIHRYPTAKARIWRCSKRPGAVIGNELAVMPSGQLALSGVTSEFDTGSLLGSTADKVPLHVWTKIDIQFCYANGISGPAPRGPYCDVYVNGVLGVSGTNNNFLTNDPAFRSFLGNPSAHDLLIDFDDWVGADIPVSGSKLTIFPSRDWNAGSRIGLVGATGLGSDHNAAVWTSGDWRQLAMRPLLQPGILNLPKMMATGQGRLTLKTNAATEVDQAKNQIGIAALTVLARAGKSGATNGTLGWRLPDGTTTLKSITEGAINNFAWTRAYFTPAGIQPLTPLTGLELIYEPATPNNGLDALGALVEIIGVHGKEDVVEKSPIAGDVPTIPEKVGIHNAPYPNTPWSYGGTAPQSPIFIVAGTYVGTGTFVELTFRAPVTFFWIRNTIPAGPGAQWWSACNSGHLNGQVYPRPDAPVQALVNPDWVTPQAPVPATQPPNIATTDPAEVTARVRWWLHEADSSDSEMDWMDTILYHPAAGQAPGWTADSYWPDQIMAGEGAGEGYDNSTNQQEMQILVRLVGTDAAHNQAGVTYHYLAFCDPGLRFCEAGALEATQGTGDLVHNLESETFTPDACFLLLEQPGSASTVGLHYKGLGHAASAVSPLGSAEITPALKMSLGALTYQSGLSSSSTAQIAHLAWRRDDKSGDPGVPRVVQILTYTGDGSASRTIGLSPLTQRRPLFAIIVPHNGACYFRDPAHTGTFCTQFPGNAVPSGGINSGGIDQINVGALLNANNVVYEVFCFVGSETAGNNGWSIDGEFMPVKPAGLSDQSPWDDNPQPPEPGGPDEPGEPDIPGGGFPGSGGADDFNAQCIGPSTTVINQALSRLGVSKRVVDITKDLTQEADTARLHYVEDVARTLRDLPWPFATRHATLALATGVASPDWTYAYRQPSDCVFERRLIAPRGGAVDPTPPPFQLSSDNQGGLIFCNVANALLEYTYRPACAAGVGDALFREALGWRLALSLAPALSRMTEAAAACEKMYEQTIAKARAILPPGVPGVPPPAATVDVSPSAQAANTAVVNRALVRIGAQTITAVSTDQSRGGVAARTLFEDELQATLRDYPWSFATAYATLTKVAGTPAAPVNADWTYAYRLPVGLLATRRLVTALGRLELHPPKYAVGADATGALLFTHETPATLEYTTRVDACVEKADAVFRDALAWRLAASLAPTVGQASPETPEQLGRGPDDPSRPRERPINLAQYRTTLSRQAWQMYAFALDTARRTHANEGEPEEWPDAPWLLGR